SYKYNDRTTTSQQLKHDILRDITGSTNSRAKLQQAILSLIPTDTALTGTATTVPGVQRNKGPYGVHGRAAGVYQPSSRARRASGIQPTDARATSG
ncbi:hypothetical protein GIB67_032151, partial [Kingdonia uniflora]